MLGNPDWNSIKFCFWNPESGKILLVVSGILSFGIRNTARGIRNRNREIDWNRELKSRIHVPLTRTGIQQLESAIHGVESRNQDCLGFPYTEGEWSAIWSLKWQVSFQTKIARHELQLPLTTAILKSQNSVISNILLIKLAGLLKSDRKQKGFYISFCARNRNDAI